jgi:hypothetical protein
MNLMELIEKARELIGGGGVDTLAENSGELSEVAQGEGSVVEKAQQAVEGLGDGGGDVGGAPGDASGGSEQR